ncbi:MAG: delayed-early response protein/equilibrative nucleoside transporter [Pseudomonadota bacterium]
MSLPILAVVAWTAIGLLGDTYNSALAWIYTVQREFHDALRVSVAEFAEKAGWASGMAIITGSFLYGIFHAAGPGHGKMILSTYLISQPEKVGRSIWLAVASSMVQGLSAIFLVYGLFFLFDMATRDTKIAVAWSERIAFGLLAVVGLVLLWRGMKALWALRAIPARDHADHNGHHDHNHGRHHSCGHDHGHDDADHHHDHGHAHHDHDHDHHHAHNHDHGHHHHAHGEVCSSCGHAHAPTAEQVDAASDWRTMVGVVLSIGMRPCTGAVLVLAFARFSDISWIGALAVLAMAAGTSITVTALALISLHARSFAVKLMGTSNGLTAIASSVVAMGGGVILFAMGYGLLTASFAAAPTRSMGL